MEEFPDSTWAAEALNNLASHYIILDDDAAADERVPRAVSAAFRTAGTAERAAWKIGLVGVQERPVCRRRAGLRQRRRRVPARGYPSGVALLVRTRARSNRRDGDRQRALSASRWLTTRTPTTGGCASKLLDARDEPVVADNVTVASTSGSMQVPTAELIRELVGARAVRRRAQGAAVRAARVGRHAGDRGHDRLDSTRAGAERNRAGALRSPARRHQHHEARLSAVSRAPVARSFRPRCSR